MRHTDLPLPSPWKVSAVYALAGALWIVASDRLLALLVDDPAVLTRFATLKGWGFVAVTAAILYRLLVEHHDEIAHTTRSIRESRALLHNVLETLPVGVWLVNREGKITHGNPAGQRIWGGARMVGIEQFAEYQGWWLATGERIMAEEWGAARAIRQGETSLEEEIEIEAFDGVRKIIRHWAVPLRDEQQRVTGAIVVNQEITRQKEAERDILAYQEQLRRMASELALIEERERRRIADALHEQIGQNLALARIKLGGLLEVSGVERCRSEAEAIRGLLEGAIAQTRSLTFELSPPVLYELGLEAALRALTERFREQHGLAADFSDDGRPKPLADAVRVLLYQAARELLVNVVKHARAGRVRVEIGRREDTVRVEVADDGAGFAHAEERIRSGGEGGFGLFSIRERLRHLGGACEVQSAAGQGTRVVLIAPLRPEEST
jgi:PAS domain S-box-containing protein